MKREKTPLSAGPSQPHSNASSSSSSPSRPRKPRQSAKRRRAHPGVIEPSLSALKLVKPVHDISALLRESSKTKTKAFSENTKDAYRHHWGRFAQWCKDALTKSLPASSETIEAYLTYLLQLPKPPAIASVALKLAAIGRAHTIKGHRDPCKHPEVVAMFRGMRRVLGAGQKQAAPAIREIVVDMCDALPSTTAGIRDRALLSLGFAGAFRRAELVALNVEDIEPSPRGIFVRVRQSKSDQDRVGVTIAINRTQSAPCPVESLEEWLRVAQIDEGPIFRRVTRHDTIGKKALTSQSVRLIVQRTAIQIGLDPKKYSAHSLRAGLATSAARAKKSMTSIKAQGRWKTTTMVERYIRLEGMVDDNAADLD